METQDFLQPCGGCVGKLLAKYKQSVQCFYLGLGTLKYQKRVTVTILILIYGIYITYRWAKYDCNHVDWENGYGLAFIIFGISITICIYNIFNYILTNYIDRKIDLNNFFRISYYIFQIIILIIFIWSVTLAAMNDTRRLISLFGYFIFLLFGLLFSKHPEYINWKIVSSGVIVHLAIGMTVINLKLGREIVHSIGKKAEALLTYGQVGARFAYGDFLVDNLVFSFSTLPVLFFMAMLINVLLFYGILQMIFYNLGGAIQLFLGTSIVESVNAVATVFLGMNEAALLYRPYIEYLTPSEIHAIMTASFATIAGSLLAAYTSFGAEASTLVTASIMAAPAALAFSKIFYPERRKTQTSISNIVRVKSSDSNVIDAACRGAYSAVDLIQGIISNLVAFISFIAFLNGMLSWCGGLAGFKGITIEEIVGKIFIPLAWMMGVAPSQCEDVARLIGIKTVVNEFVAYKELGLIKKANKLSHRSEAIATVALCGFANPCAVAIMIALLSGMCPAQRKTITRVALRSFIAGSCATFMSASITGLLIPEAGYYENKNMNNFNETSVYNSSHFKTL